MARVPGYRLHKPSGLAFIEIRGRRHYLGKHGTPTSQSKYRGMLAEHLAGLAIVDVGGMAGADGQDPLTVDELILAFAEHVRARYQKRGKPTSEVRSFKRVLGIVGELYGNTPADEFGPRKLATVRQRLIEAGYCRKRINGLISRVRLCWKWGVANEIVSETTWRALGAVPGLRAGECQAIDLPPVEPVATADVDAIQQYLSPTLWGMVQFQLFTGCRPGEACSLRMCDLRMVGEIWEFVPESHKTEHHGRRRVIFVGPKAQAAIRPFLRVATTEYLFQPRESKEWYLSQRRKTGAPNKPEKRHRTHQRQPGEQFTADAYGKAIRKACRKAGIPEWSPNQLRHAAGTAIRAEFGLEASRVVLGHVSAATTEIYAQADQQQAKEIIRRLG